MTVEETSRPEGGGRAGEIIVRHGDDVVAMVPLNAQEIIIGRSPSNTLVLPDPTVSSHHARLHPEGDDWLLTDTGSTNGTIVNGTTLLRQQPVRLSDGAEIVIGPFSLLYSAPQIAPEVASVQPDMTTVAFAAGPDGGRRPAYISPVMDAGAPSRYLPYLPTIFQDSDFLRRFLLIFETIWEPLEWRQDHIDMYFDPRTCPAALLPWLAGRLDLTFPPGWPEGRMRTVLADATTLLRWRGTRYGLERMIEVFTGLIPTIGERSDEPFVFRITLVIPAGETVDDTQIDALIRTHKPAHAGYVLEVLRERAS
jgi:phage tail-like protein